MRLIIFSDIHGNKYALEQFIKQTTNKEHDFYIFCGDIFGYYYNQDEIIDILKGLDNLLWIKGNHDEYAVRIYASEDQASNYINKYGHSYLNIRSKIKKENIELIKKLPTKIEITLDHKKIGIFHGTPKEPLEGRLYPKDNITDSDMYKKYDYVFLGHTHFKMTRLCNNTKIINPGSLGQQRDGKGFGYAEFDTVSGKTEFFNVEFNLHNLLQEIEMNDRENKKLVEILYREEK